MLAEPPAVQAGTPFWTAVRLTMDPGWHTYWKDPGDSGLATQITWRLPAGFTAGPIQWPVPQRLESPPLVDFGYEGEVALLVEITPPASLPDKTITLAAQVTWLECADVCIPGKTEVSLTLPVSRTAVSPSAESAAFFAAARTRLPRPGEEDRRPGAPPAAPPPLAPGLAVLFAFVGGLLLNLMPCVLPVLSLKVIGFWQTPPGLLRRQGLLYGAGVLVSFWTLASLLIGLRAGGETLGWGFQLQSPAFVGFLAFLFFLLGLNLLGVFEIGTSLVGLGGWRGEKSSRTAFLSGGLAVLVATPCTAPFMGPALGLALTQPAATAFSVFTALGLGMAAPYVFLSFFPSGLRRLPKPGPWMITLKQAMAFPFFGTTIWLLWVLGLQRGVGALTGSLTALLGLGIAAWLGGPLAQRSPTDQRRTVLRWAAGALGVTSVLLGLRTGGPASAPVAWEVFSESGVEARLAEGRPVFVDFTAAWCLTCQVNERTTLSSSVVQAAFRERNVALFKADWTNRDPVIARALEKLGRDGVPVYVLYAPEPRVLPALLTPDILLKALEDIPKRSFP